MKKIIFTLLFLLILGGCGFFFGWAQLNVPQGSFGVISSKTHGFDDKLVQSGEFRWLWYKLIPTNVRISIFKPEPQKFSMNIKNSLPSGSAYASFAGLSSMDFLWEFKAELAFQLNPEKLIQLVSKNNITDQKELDNYLNDTAKKIEAVILRVMSSDETDNARLENLLEGKKDIELENEIASLFPEIRDFSFIIESAQFPDFALYRQVRLLYDEFLTKQREVVTTTFGKSAENRIAAQLRFDELDRYGELLTKYPILLDYIALEQKINLKAND